MKKVYIAENIEEAQYDKFLNFCERTFESIFFFEREDFPWPAKNGEALLRELSSNVLGMSLTLKYRTGEEVGYPHKEMKQYEVKCNSSSIASLKKFSRKIFNWQQPELFEDLCFEGKNGRAFYSIAHEKFGYFFLEENEIYELRKELGSIILEEKDFLDFDKLRLLDEDE